MTTITDIIGATAVEFGTTAQDIIGPSRRCKHVVARQIVYGLAREMTKLSLPQIGRRMGGRHHTTVLEGLCRRYPAHCAEYGEAIVRIRAAMGAQSSQEIVFRTCRAQQRLASDGDMG